MEAKMTPGQRWISEPEPELGLGLLEEADAHQMLLFFPASGERRRYALANAPIKRVRFREGDTIRGAGGPPVVVEEVEERAGIIHYHCGDLILLESDLSDSISFSTPEERLTRGQVDDSRSFDLRYDAICHDNRMRRSEVAGLVGGRIDLIPHQISIASDVANRYLPRVLLADEVGLGKTIEACLILHRLYLTGRAQRILILVPESLVHQWFVELLRRFNLWFTLMDEERCLSITGAEEEAAERNPFLEDQRLICSTQFLARNKRWADLAISAGWDILVVDEAHHLAWSPEAASPEYLTVEALARRSPGLLLLTATPEQLGATGHFARLRLLDPARYTSLDAFQKGQKAFAKVAAVAEKLFASSRLSSSDKKVLREILTEQATSLDETLAAIARGDEGARRQLLEDLIDRHGTGRVIFRNTREALSGFPKRIALPAPLDPRPGLTEEELHARLLREYELDGKAASEGRPLNYKGGPRIHWLANLLRDLPNEKFLVICRTPEKVLAIDEALQSEISVSSAVFHEHLTLIQRDRNAAWFAEKEGARVLICSEIGSEGRNFQFAHHLVLFDLPVNSELLEQRIGRLDRIGQTAEIKIHIPYLRGSALELLKRWHHDGLEGIEHSLRGGNTYTERFGDHLRRIARHYHTGDQQVRAEADTLIADTSACREDLEEQLRKGQDRLLSLNSFQPERAAEHIEQIREIDQDTGLDHFMNRIYDEFGVEVEDFDERSLYLRPSNLFVDSFPELPEEGVLVTYQRSKALAREDIQFLTWDHPMVRGAVDMLLSSERGNCSFVAWPNKGAPNLLIEAIYVLECVAPPRLHTDRFLPPTPVRVVVDATGTDRTEDYPVEAVRAHARDESSFRLHENPAALQSLVPHLIHRTRDIARDAKKEVLEESLSAAHRHLNGEARRLRELKQINQNVRDEEIKLADRFLADITRHIKDAHLRLDAVRLILQGPERPAS